MAQGKTENPVILNLFEKQQVSSLRPWQLRTLIAPFGIIDIKIDRVKVRPGEIVTLSFKAVNTADFTTIYPVTLKINYEVVAAEVISLPQKSMMPMRFTIAKTIPGNYRVDINNSIDTFTVMGNPLENEIARIEGFQADIGNMEARLDLSSSQPAPQTEQREVSVINSKSVAIKHKKVNINKQEPSKINRVQSGIDRVADYIENGLDKTGDIITFPIDKLVNFSAALFKPSKKK